MPTVNAIRTKYKKLHDDLSKRYYSEDNKLTKDEFDIRHGKIWNDLQAELIVNGYFIPSPPARNLKAEVDDLKIKVAALEKV